MYEGYESMEDYKSKLSQILDEGKFPEDAFYLSKVFKDRKIIVYGAGESFAWFKKVVIKTHGYIPSLVLDRKFCRGDTIDGIPACSPNDYVPTYGEKENAIVVICLGNVCFFDDVVQLVKRMGFKHIISLLDIYEIHNPFSLPIELEKEGFQFYHKNREKIEICFNIFSDEQSKEIYVKCLQTHIQRKPVPIPMHARTEQYIPKDIQLSKGYSNFIYCGVSPGEIPQIFNQIGKVEKLVCIDPDPKQFKLIAEYLEQNIEQIAHQITALPCAVYSREAIERFTHSYTSYGTRIIEAGESNIQSITIDHTLFGFNPTFISMDIEGAELKALKGAEKTIRSSIPDLGICVYHSPHHLWEIPLYLNSLGLGYRFYLRNYTSFLNETVLYATQ